MHTIWLPLCWSFLAVGLWFAFCAKICVFGARDLSSPCVADPRGHPGAERDCFRGSEAVSWMVARWAWPPVEWLLPAASIGSEGLAVTH